MFPLSDRLPSPKLSPASGVLPYRPPRYLRDGLVQTLAVSLWYGRSWCWWGDRVSWMRSLPHVPWQEKVFRGAEDVPLWGIWSCPPQAIGTLILNYGIAGTTQTAWYAHALARKVHARGFAVLLYDWRSHGRTASLSPVPSSDGWREGSDQVQLASQLVALGCPSAVILVGFSLGGQLALWGLKAAAAEGSTSIRGAVVLSPNLESDRSLTHLESTRAGRAIASNLTRELQRAARDRQRDFPDAIAPESVARIDSIRAFDRELVVDYYGFASVEDYYRRTSGLYLLDKLALPYLVIYAADDPMFDPTLVPELAARVAANPLGRLLLTANGGHVAHVGLPAMGEDEFWGLNRMVDFCVQLATGYIRVGCARGRSCR
ncbi:putative hydrolase of the alpha/beta-hydrolase fold protein [Rubidibacter lacunae KORDI 51-2]|uniref:Putative hydrolase of the alpha/beta-hydrolase fold protein n=1 Tax=Rubidibacter lacunae KORDI 51-2 TaxID=582515 RepID=U5DK40_9CHRO|nr:alpha/beta fold hydrolase [Rubidibacter lacunae]ERN40944.1 putative hydrolase of the alpha/beta-hydrolase fold protein [Rubidibacter lacunae KORDI 51-2]